MKLTTKHFTLGLFVLALFVGGLVFYFRKNVKQNPQNPQSSISKSNKNKDETFLNDLTNASYICSAKYKSGESESGAATIYYKAGNMKYEMSDSSEPGTNKFQFLLLSKDKKAYVWDDSNQMAFEFEFDLSKQDNLSNQAKGFFSNFSFNINFDDLSKGNLDLEDIEKSIDGKCEFKDVPDEVFELPAGITFNKFSY